jgi:hypothetical protein
MMHPFFVVITAKLISPTAKVVDGLRRLTGPSYSISSCRQLGVHMPASNQQRYQHEERSHPSFHVDVMLEILPCTVAVVALVSKTTASI